MRNKQHKPRFSGEVWVTFKSSTPKKYTIKEASLSLIGIYMYSFEGTDMRVGENYLRKSLSDRKLTITECLHNEYNDTGLLDEAMASLLSGKSSQEMCFEKAKPKWDSSKRNMFEQKMIFFRPDNDMIDWLVEYADGRLICEVGCGSCVVLAKLADAGAKVIGIEPDWDIEDMEAITRYRIEQGKDLIHVLAKRIEDCKKFIDGLGKEILFLVARPSHGDWVENLLDLKQNDTEVLYITTPASFKKYDDLGTWKNSATPVEYKGWSADEEIFFSIKNKK